MKWLGIFKNVAYISIFFAVSILIFNLDNGGRLSSFIAGAFSDRETLLTLSGIVFLNYCMIRGSLSYIKKSQQERKGTRFLLIWLFTLCFVGIAGLILPLII